MARRRALLFLLTVVACTATPAAERSVTVAGTPASLSVLAEEASLREVLEYIAHHQRLAVESHASLDETVSVEIVDETLAATLRRLLRDYNFTLSLQRGADVTGRLWIHPRGPAAESMDPAGHFGVAGRDDRAAALRRLARGNAAERLDATAVLAAFGGDDAFVALTNALYDEDPAVREEAVAGLADRPPSESVHLLGAAVLDPSAVVRTAAIDALADLDTDTAAAKLAPLLDSGDVNARIDAVDALGEMRSPRASVLLARALRDTEEAVRTIAAEYLAERRE